MKKKIKHLLLIITGLSYMISCTVNKSHEKIVIDNMLKYCVEKTKVSMASLCETDSLPRNILSNQKEWNKVCIHDWTSGFWPGVLWYAYETSGDTAILKNAEKFTELLEGVLSVPVENHDLGFMMYNSFGKGYLHTKNEDYKRNLLKAADSLATLFNPKVGTILSWPAMRDEMNWPHNTIIDNMMNLELLFWASKNGGEEKLYDIAVKHAETCMTTLIRPDYSIYHVAVFDTVDGHFINGYTHQGYSDNSTWARGQSWGIYGFTMCYRETGKPEFLSTAKNLADVFINRLPEDAIPFWDFDDPDIPNAPKDASAAAIAASGLLELSMVVKDQDLKNHYNTEAFKILAALSSNAYLSGDKNQSFLLHSTGHKPHNSEVDASIIYADYYYFEALTRAKRYLN